MLKRALQGARANTDALLDLVRPEALYERPVAERHRLVFYLGHLEVFDWNLLGRYALHVPPFHASFDQLFAFGIDPEPGRGPADTRADWPSLDEVRRHNRRLREEIDSRVDAVPDQLMNVAIEHRLMHAETLACLLHNLPVDRKCGPAPDPAPERPTPVNPMLDVPTGPAMLGKRRGDGFGWDNEFERHEVNVPAFRISRYKVSNGEYLGYVRATGAPPPHFWSGRDGAWRHRAMFGEIPLPLDWPAYITHAEATAYAGWAGRTLPSEAQFHRASEGARAANTGFERWEPIAVDASPHSASAYGVEQLRGNGWEWTSTVFEPFPGFEPFPFYPGYSADFFDGGHFVLKGGSARTASRFLRPTFRNWFRPNYPHVYAGFRLVER